MCMVFSNEQEKNISSPNFFKNIYSARIFAYKRAKRHIVNIPALGYRNREVIIYVRIFKIPYSHDAFVEYSNSFVFWNNHIATIRDPKETAARIIQRMCRFHYKTKIRAVRLIQRNWRLIISNPYTLLCKKRLLREYYNDNCIY